MTVASRKKTTRKTKTLRRKPAQKVVRRTTRSRVGSSFDDFLESEGLRTEVTVLALKRVIAWQVAEEMKRQKLTKQRMAELMETSRAAVDRLLDPTSSSLSLRTLDKAAQALGKRVMIELVGD